MNKIKWWARVVGAWYVFLGAVFTFGYFTDPELNAGFWGPNIYTAGLPVVCFWLLLGALLLIDSRSPEKVSGMVRIVALVEILVWIPSDASFLANGLPQVAGLIYILLHLIIGLTGLLFLKSQKQVTFKAGFTTT